MPPGVAGQHRLRIRKERSHGNENVRGALLLWRRRADRDGAPGGHGVLPLCVLSLVGRRAVAESDLSPEGLVDLDGERWRAVAHDGTVRAGEQVQVIRVEGVTLHVIPQ